MDKFSNLISNTLSRFKKCTIFVDDVRGFSEKDGNGDYPSKDYLIDWANQNNLTWSIEHDIFIAKKFKVDGQNL